MVSFTLESQPHFAPSPMVLDQETASAIARQQTEGLLRNRATISANIIVALLSLFVLRDSVPAATLLSWFAGITALSAVRLWLSRWLRDSTLPPPRKLHLFTAGTVLSGLGWGCLPVLLLAAGTVPDFAFAGFMIAGMTAGGIAALCWYHPAYLGYLLGATLPLTACLLLLREPVYQAMAAQVMVYTIMLVVISALYSRRLLQTLHLENQLERERSNLEAMRRELALAQSSKWLTLAQLSHHLRTPMNAVIGFSAMLHGGILGPIANPRHKDYINDIHESGTRALRTITEILEVSQAEAGILTLAKTDVDVRATLANCLRSHGDTAARQRVTLTAEIAGDLPLLSCDGARLRQILDQLLSNALRHTPPGGRVTLGAGIAGPRWLAIRIADTGAGIPASRLAEAMTPFVQFDEPMVRQHDGIGIGLPLARRLVELHGGEFTLSSAAGHGTTAIIRLPLSAGPEDFPA